MHLLTLWIFATCFNSAAYTGRSAWGCCEISGDCFCLDALLGTAAWTLVCHSCLIFFLLLSCLLVGFSVCSWICRQSEAFFIAPPQVERAPPSWLRCVVWLYVRCVPPVCWYIMPPQVVMIAVSGALGQCPTHPWWPPCCAMLAWHYFVAVGTKHCPRLKSSSRLTSPATLRTMWSWPPCEWCFSKSWFLTSQELLHFYCLTDFSLWLS